METQTVLFNFVRLMCDELNAVATHPFFTRCKEISDQFAQTGPSFKAESAVRHFLSEKDSGLEARDWFHEQYGWICGVMTMLDVLRDAEDEIVGFKDLDDEVRKAFSVLDFVNTLA